MRGHGGSRRRRPPPPHRHVAAEQQRRHEPPPQRPPAVDPLGDQAAQDERALRVADQHDAAAAVVVAQVVAPRTHDVAVGTVRLLRRHAAGEEALERDLPVDRREDAAVARVARRLVERDRAQLGVDRERGRRGGLVADRRVDVEAVDLPRPRAPHPLAPEPLAGRREAGRAQARAARVVLQPRLAEPDRPGLGGRRRQQRRGEHEQHEATHARTVSGRVR